MSKLSLKQILGSGASRMLGSYAFGFLTQGVYFVLIARTLESTEFGLFAGAMALVSVMASLVGAGSGNVLVLETARNSAVINVQMATAIIYILTTAVPFAAVSLGIAALAGPQFLIVITPLIVSEIFTLRLFDLAQQAFQAKDQLGRTAICGILAGFIRVFIAIAFTLVPMPSAAQWSVWYSATTVFTSALVLTWALKSTGRPVVDRQSLRSTWRVGVFFSLGTASRTLYMDADKFILSSYGMLAASGSFSAASKIITMASAPIQALVYSLNTRLFRAGMKGSSASWKVIRKPLVGIVCYGAFIGFVLWVASPLVPLLLGSTYQEASRYLWLLAPLVALNGVHYLFGDALMGLGKQAVRSVVQFGAACVAVLFNIVCIPLIGAESAIISALACSFGLALIMSVIFARTYKADIRRRSPGRHSQRRLSVAVSETLRILHVSQASSGGVLNALVQLSNSQKAHGADVIVIYGRRPDTPSSEELHGLFAPGVRLIEAPGKGMGPAAASKLYSEVLKAIRVMRPDYIHLHSSFAGAVGRLASLSAWRQSSTFYSPHGFSFLRQDIAAWKRHLFAYSELIFHSIGSSMVLVSGSERDAAKRMLSSKRLYVLENGIDTETLPPPVKSSDRPRVGSAGRITYAKAPWKFSALASSLTQAADFLWIGGADSHDANEWVSSTSVEVTGWLSEESAVSLIAGLDIYVSTSLWEGLPIAVLQAQALGIPCVVSDCVGNIDIVENGVTGFIVADEVSLADRVLQLINDPELRSQLGENARNIAVPRFDSKRLGPDSFHIYRDAISACR